MAHQHESSKSSGTGFRIIQLLCQPANIAAGIDLPNGEGIKEEEVKKEAKEEKQCIGEQHETQNNNGKWMVGQWMNGPSNE